MMKRNASSQDDRPSLIAELIIPVASIAYAIYYVGSIWNFPQHTQTSGRFLAGILLVFSVLCILKIIIKSLKGSYKLSLGDSFGPQETMLKRAGFFCLILVYVATVRWGGFTLTTFLFIFLSLLTLGIKPIKKSAIIAAVAALCGWIFFIVLLGTRFPRGPFEQLVGGIL